MFTIVVEINKVPVRCIGSFNTREEANAHMQTLSPPSARSFYVVPVLSV